MRPKLNYANVMSTLCFFLLLGGGAYAAGHLGKNSVGSKQLKKNAVTSPKVKDHSLLASDFGEGQLPEGKQGPEGERGQAATKLFAFINDGINPPNETAKIVYGNGVTSVTDPSGDGSYTVTFDQSLTKCVVYAQPGAAEGGGTAFNGDAIPSVEILENPEDNKASVALYSAEAKADLDSAFFIAAFC